jgi:hypothetical protein
MAQQDPRKEASDPSTDPERLRELTRHEDLEVYRTALRNPAVPEDIWREALLYGQPEAWANPMAPFYVLTWTPRKDERSLEDAAWGATNLLWGEPDRCSPEGKALLAAKVQEGWATSQSAWDMMWLLGMWAQKKRKNSPEHREAVRVLVLCVRTTPDLTDEDRQALDLLDAWGAGGEDRRYEAYELASSQAVKKAFQVADDPVQSALYAMDEVAEAVAFRKKGAERQRAKAEHNRLMADLIRREMPVPPVVD